MDEWKRSGKIPTFGDWEKANEMPITQYFESARQAGLIRYMSNSSGDCQQYMPGNDVYAHFKKTSQDLGPPCSRKTRGGGGGGGRERRMGMGSHVREQKKQGKVYDVTEPTPTPTPTPRKQQSNVRMVHSKFPKPVDEDLYKIPPHLLRSSKRKKLPGFFSCLVPGCAS